MAYRRLRDSPFLMTAKQHRSAAAKLRAQGHAELARQHENMAKIIEARSHRGWRRASTR
jgi:hypothetical protein